MNTSRNAFGMTVVMNTIVVCGGWSAIDNAAMSSCEQFRDGLWMTMPALPISVAGLEMITLNSRVYIFGGWNGRHNDVQFVYTHALNEVHITNNGYIV